MERRHSGSPSPKKLRVQNSAGKFLTLFFLGGWGGGGGIKTASSSLIIFQRPKYQRGVLIISSGATERHFEGKSGGTVNKVVLFLYDNAPAHRALATQKKLAYLGFQFLYHPLCSPDLAPWDYHLFPGLKKQLKGRHFSSDAEFIAAVETRFDDNFLIFFEWLAKVRATG